MMKGGEQILELLTEVLRKQDRTQEKLNRITGQMREVRQDVREVKATQAVLLENQQGHQQVLRILAINQQKSQRELQNIVDILNSVARMQRDTSRRLDHLENPSDFV